MTSLVILRFKYFLHDAFFFGSANYTKQLENEQKEAGRGQGVQEGSLPAPTSQGLSHSPAHSKLAGNFATPPLIRATKARLHQSGNPVLEPSGHNLSFVGQE